MLRAIGTNVLIRRKQSETMSEGGILIPEAAVKKHNEGDVVSVGEGVVSLKVGDRVIFNTHSGAELEDGILVMDNTEVLAVRGENAPVSE